MSHYAKSIVAVLVAGITALQAAITDSVVTQSEWIAIVLAVVTAIGVYAVPNKPAGVVDAGPVNR